MSPDDFLGEPFFIICSFEGSCFSGTDDSNVVRILHEDYEKQPVDGRITHDDLPSLVFRMIRVVMHSRQIVEENGFRLGEGDAVLAPILPRLPRIPSEWLHIASLSDRQG